jgi:excisionase family DNA binding protein
LLTSRYNRAKIAEFALNLSFMAPSDELLTVGEAAARLHVSKQAIRRWIADGKLKASRTPGGHYRIRAADADAALRET